MREFFFSLGVKDRAAAKRLVQEHSVIVQARLDEAEASLVGAPALQSREQTLQLEQSAAQSRAAAEKAKRFADRAPFRDYWRKRFALSTAEMDPEEAALKDLFEAGPVDPAVMERLRSLEEPVRQERLLRKAISKRPDSGASISDLFAGYASQEGLRPETINQFRAMMNHLIAFLGHNDAGSVGYEDGVKWRNHLQQEQLARGSARSAKTINDSYLASAKAVFAHGVDQLTIANNPFKEVAKVRATRKIKLRNKDFTQAERIAILSASLRPIEKNLSPERVAAFRWVPWLCAYTGARVNEMTQLRGEDVREIDGIWSIHITPEAGGVKTDEARLIPMHHHLIEQGFLEFCADRTGPLFYDPARLRNQSGMARGQYKKVGMALAAWVRELGVTDKAIQPNHAWRHTFKTICLEVGIEERAADYIQGHATKGVGRRYGSNPLPALAEQIQRFPQFNIA